MQELERTAGVGGRKDILPVKNFSEEMEPTAEVSVLMCRALQQALYAAEDFVAECGPIETLSSDLSDL